MWYMDWENKNVLDGVAKMFHIPPHNISNPDGAIDILIGLESGQMLLREVHRVDGNEVQKTHFSRDLQLASAILTDLLVVKRAVGGECFGANNSIYYSDASPAANLLRSVSSADSHYLFNQQPSQEDLNLVPVGANVTHQFPARVMNPLSCSTMIKELKKRDDRDEEHRGDRPTASNFSSTLLYLNPLHKPPILQSLCQG